MSDNDESSMIGYDPLAWLQEADQESSKTADEAKAQTSAFADWVGADEDENLAEIDDWDAPNRSDETVSLATEQVSSDKTIALTTTLSDQPIVLASVQTIQNVALLHEKLLHALDTHTSIDIDASAVTTIDTATLQLLVVLKQTAGKQQKQVAIDFPSERFSEAADLLGLSEILAVDKAAAGFF